MLAVFLFKYRDMAKIQFVAGVFFVYKSAVFLLIVTVIVKVH